MNTRKITVFALGVLLVLGMLATWVVPALAQGQSGTTLSATKTATGHWTRTFHWTIDKSVTPATWNLFRGDSGTSRSTIAVTKDAGTDEAWVEGQICVTNGGAVATVGLQIVDELRDGVPPPRDLIATVNVDVSAHPVLEPGETYCYPYRVDIPSAYVYANGKYKNTANVTIMNHSGHLGEPFGPSPSVDDTYLPSSPTLINDTIHVDDSNGGSWEFSATSGSVTYDKTFTCDADAGTHNNTATIREEPDQSKSASVTVNCYALEVTKDAHTSFTRTWTWTIAKEGDQSELTLSIGQQFQVNYSVVVDATYTDSDWAVNGTIWAKNPAPMAATLTNVQDMADGILASVDCPSLSVPSGETLECTYSASLPDASSRTNTATATLQNYDYDHEMNATPDGTTDFSGTADVVFGYPTTEIDEVVTVTDDQKGLLAQAYGPDTPLTMSYSMYVGPYDVCGTYEFINTATFVTNDTVTTGSDSWTVNVTVPCVGGCTLTQGYWKTHSEFGPAPYDDTWAMLPSGASTPFFLSGQSWYQVLWTPPAGGNAYYILAHQYIGAKLNILNGAASTPAVDETLAWAESFFGTYTPSSRLSKTLRAQAISYANLLDQYNNGYIGPGHCSE